MLADGTVVKVHYRGTLDDGSVFDSSDGQRPRTFVLGRGQLIPDFERALLTMQPGEVIDVRPAEEFAAGHLPNAINIPIDRLDQELERLPTDGEVIAYCRGPYCLLAFEAVTKLRDKGFAARRLEDGFPEWKLAALPIERTSPRS